MTRSASYFMALALWLAGGSARADVVGGEPASCPHGGTPSTCHGGAYCALEECQTDTDCAVEKMVCREVSVCVGKVVCAGLLPPDANLSDYERPTIEGVCSNGEGCTDGAYCAYKRVCAPSEPAPARKKDEVDGCAVRAGRAASSTNGTLAAILGLTFVSALARHRRRPVLT
jgi:MYXO-CTERM domain-containing protein